MFRLAVYLLVFLAGCVSPSPPGTTDSPKEAVIIQGESDVTYESFVFDWSHPYGSIAGNPLSEHKGKVYSKVLTSKFSEPIYWAVASDIDGDALGELVVIDGRGVVWTIELNAGEIAARRIFDLGSSDSSPVLGDVNGDGLKDVIFVSEQGKLTLVSSPPVLLLSPNSMSPN